MAFLFGLVLGLATLQNAAAQQALPFYEPFPGTYVNGEYLGSATGVAGSTSGGTSGVLWNFGNSLSSSCARVENYAALQYPGLTNIDATAQSYGLMSYYKDGSSVKDRGAALAIPTNGSPIYASCLVNFQHITNANTAAFFGLTASSSGSVSHSGAVIYINPAGYLQIAKNNSSTPATNATYTLTVSNTYLLVLRYKYNPGNLDQVDLWVNPTSLGNDAAIPAPTITTTNNSNLATNYFGAVAYFQAALPTLFYLDEIRVATNWSGVTPTNAPPGNLYSVTGGGSGCAGASFNVGVSGSDSGVSYLLFTNGVFTGSSVDGNGSAVGFGLQNVTALYTVLGTNNTTGKVGWMSGSATVSVTPAPNIAVQPVSALVATNGLAAFSVASSGNGLSYAWYRNGTALSDGGHVSGSQTTNLVISPATTADAATVLNGYYVKVSNPCGGFITSVTNALVLHPAANLVWYGDGVSNLWDVAISTNWNFNSTLEYPTDVFNFGDNVTFDDTSANTTVNLSNPNLSPTLLTVNGTGSQNYTFANNGGVLAGGGLIVMNSLGALNLNVPNNETGGITISNGTIYYYSPAALGYGPITLAGGGLAGPGTGIVTVTNAINVVGSNSVIGANSPGGQPLVLTGPLTGTGGSLILSNSTAVSKAATPNLQITMTNLNFNLPVDLNVGSISGSGLNIVGNNTSGTQIWNGLVTDGGSMQRSGSGGTTLLNNTNTYSGGTKLSGGSLGVGADSISILSPPAVDAGPLGTGTFYVDTGTATMQLFAFGGPHIVGNVINWASTNFGSPWIISGTNNLTLTGSVDLSGTNRVIEIDNTAITVMSGVITDDGNGYGLTKTGNGVLYLDGANSYTGATTNSAGTLAGSGTVAGPAVVQSGATIGAGDAGAIPGTLTLNGGLTLNGDVAIRINKLLAQSNDLVSVTGSLANTGTGTITVTNVGPTLAVGDTFTIFSAAVTGGNTLTVTGGGANWNNHLAVDGSIQVQSIISGVLSYPTNIGFTVSGNSLTITWPPDHLGWELAAQTNTLATGLGKNWVTNYGTAGVTSTNLTINPANAAVFYKLVHP
jgi:autotransporter-associated beta strand protein